MLIYSLLKIIEFKINVITESQLPGFNWNQVNCYSE